MCDLCKVNPCHSRCPNAEPSIFSKCKECGGDILIGDRYYNSNKGFICYECLSEMTVLELVELFGEELEIAE